MTPVPDREGRILSAAEGRGRLFLERTPDCDTRALYAEPYADEAALERRWAVSLDRYAALAREVGATLLVLTPPDAHGVHPEDLPADWSFAGPTVGDVFAARFGDRIEVIHPREALSEADGAAPVWRRTDSHWTAWGAYIAYRMVMDRLPGSRRRRVVQADEFELAWRPDLGDLGALSAAAAPALAPFVHIPGARARPVDDRTNTRRDAYKVFETDDPSLPTCLVFRDSFAVDLAPYLVESFRRTVLVAACERNFPELIGEERPDVVIVERAERALPQGVYDWSATTWREAWPQPGTGPEELAAAAAERRAVRALERGDAEAAREAALEAVRIGSTPDRLFQQGRAHLACEDRPAAADAFAQALEGDPGRFAFLLHLGVARMGQDSLPQARDLFARACALHPWHPMGHEHLGYACLQLGELEPAVSALERAVRLGPESAGAWAWLAEAHQARGRADLALAALGDGLAACPGDPALTVRYMALSAAPVDIARAVA